MLAGGRVQRLDAILDPAQRVGIEIDARCIVAQLAHRLAGLRCGGLDQLDDRREARIVGRQRSQAARHGAQLRERCALGLGQRLERRLRAGKKTRAVLHAGLLGADLLPFTFTRRELLEKKKLVLHLGAFGLPCRVIFLGLHRDGLEPLPVTIEVAGVEDELLGTGLRIEQVALRGGAQQRLVRVLAVNVDQVLAGLFQLGQRRGMAVDEAARAAGTIDGSSQNDLTRVAAQVTLGEPRGQRALGIDIEFGRQLRPLGTVAHRRSIAAAADEQLDGIHQHRLPGAGLTGEHSESVAEIDGGFFNQHEPPDVERAQHGPTPGRGSSRVLRSSAASRAAWRSSCSPAGARSAPRPQSA